jgi:hypothetical protein
MELVCGIRITDYCDQANLSTRDRLDLFIKVCHAIQHAHQKGIIHRDIKWAWPPMIKMEKLFGGLSRTGISGEYVTLMGFPGKQIGKDGMLCTFRTQELPLTITHSGHKQIYIMNERENGEVFNDIKGWLGGLSGSPAYTIGKGGASLAGFVKSGFKQAGKEKTRAATPSFRAACLRHTRSFCNRTELSFGLDAYSSIRLSVIRREDGARGPALGGGGWGVAAGIPAGLAARGG